MEPTNKREFIKSRVDLAKEKIEAAKKLLESGFYRDSVSRAYYAMYHLAKAVLVLQDKNPYSHRGVKILLASELVRHGLMDKDIYNLFVLAKEKREDADYRELIKITKKDAVKAVENAEIFIRKGLEIIKKSYVKS